MSSPVFICLLYSTFVYAVRMNQKQKHCKGIGESLQPEYVFTLPTAERQSSLMGSTPSTPQQPEVSRHEELGDASSRSGYVICPPPSNRDLTPRAIFEGHGCTIFAYPSTGGVVIKNDSDFVDMEFLGLDRVSPPEKRDYDDFQEDVFSRQLRKAGGKWWPDIDRYVNVIVGAKELTIEERVERYFGWLGKDMLVEESSRDPEAWETGVHVLQYDVDDPEECETAKLRMAITMAEKVELMKQMGAKLYTDPREYDGLKDAYNHCSNLKLQYRLLFPFEATQLCSGTGLILSNF